MLKKILPAILVLVLIAGTVPTASAASTLTIDRISHDSTVVKQESFTVESSITASNVGSTISVTVTLLDNTGGALSITSAEQVIQFTTNMTKTVQWTVTANTAGTYTNPLRVTATASDEGTATPATSDSLTIQERPVLAVTFTSDEASVCAGGSVQLDFTIMNSASASAADATGVSATLTLPDGWSRVSGPSSYTFATISGGESQSGSWTVSASSPGASNTLTLTVQSTLPGGTITKRVTITKATSTPTPTPAPRGGGGGGGTSPTAISETSVSTEPTGEVTSTVTGTSTDAKASVTITEGTIAKDADGNPLTSVTVSQPSALPAGVPSGVNYVAGYAYTFGPAGATFSKPVEISITFDSADFEGKTPVIYTYDYEAGAWKALETTVVGNKATAMVDHFSIFVLFAAEKVTLTLTSMVTPTPTIMPTPTPTSILPVALPGKSSGGWIIGIIIAAAVVIAGVGAYYYYTKKKA